MRRIVLLCVVLLVGTVGNVALGAGPAAAEIPHCQHEVVDAVTGRTTCAVDLNSPGGQGGGQPGAPDPAARWKAFGCAQSIAYQPGFQITFTVLSQIPHASYDTLNAQTGSPGYRHLDPAVDYFSVLVHCQYPGAAPGGVIVTLAGPELNPGPDPIALRTQALSQVTIGDPPPASNPPLDDPGRFGVVRIPTWYWLDGAYWTPIVRSVTDPTGVMTVTVTATPQQALWDPGDGSAPVRCTDAGVTWAPGMAETATTCSHTYTSSSADVAGARYQAQVSVQWEFTWAINGAPQGAFGNVTVATPFTYAVGEIQAIQG